MSTGSTKRAPSEVPELLHPSEEVRITFALTTLHQMLAEQPAAAIVQKAVLMWVIRVLSIRLASVRSLSPSNPLDVTA